MQNGRWWAMVAGDINGNSYTNIIVGFASTLFGKMLQLYKDNWYKKAASVIIFENTLTC